MGIRIALNHRTRYDYDRSVRLGPQIVRLRPAPHSRSPILSYSLRVQPTSHFVNWQQDPWGNLIARFVFHPRPPGDTLDPGPPPGLGGPGGARPADGAFC